MERDSLLSEHENETWERHETHDEFDVPGIESGEARHVLLSVLEDPDEAAHVLEVCCVVLPPPNVADHSQCSLEGLHI